VLQGLSLPLVISRLGLEGDEAEKQEQAEARLRAAEAALSKLAALRNEDWVHQKTAERMRELYEFRRQRFAAWINEQSENGEEEGYEQRSQAYQRLRRELLAAEREALLKLRGEGRISDEVRRDVERDLDLEEERLEI
jgi:monovalent cation/hydrogen antiporter